MTPSYSNDEGKSYLSLVEAMVMILISDQFLRFINSLLKFKFQILEMFQDCAIASRGHVFHVKQQVFAATFDLDSLLGGLYIEWIMKSNQPK